MLEHMNRNLLTLQFSGIRRFTALAKATPNCAMLTIGEPDFDTPDPICERAIRSLQERKTHYAPNAGDTALREAIADFARRSNGYDYRPEEVLVTHGATEALSTALLGILNPGDEVIVPIPAFSLYESVCTMAGAKPVLLDTAGDDFQITAEKLRACLSPRTKAIVLNSPNNPTGAVYTPQTLDGVYEAVKDRPIFIVCDDVYEQLSYAPCPSFAARHRDLRERILVVQSFSKPYAMTGWRMGYLLGDAAVIGRLLLLHAALIATTCSFSQEACITALGCDVAPMREQYRRRRDYLYERLLGMGLPCVKPEGAFYAFPSIASFGLDAEAFCRRMIQEGLVAAVPGTCFGAEGFLRLSFCYSMEELTLGLDRMERFLQSLR